MATLAVRNNNPGNLKDPATGSFRTFQDPSQGMAALEQDLTGKVTGNTRTGLKPTSSLYDFAATYAPASDNNDPKSYAEKLASQLGVTPDTPLSALQNRIHEFAGAVAHNEDSAYPSLSKAGSQPLSSKSIGQLSHEQLIANINAMEQQGAKPDEIQGYLDSLKQPSSGIPSLPSAVIPGQAQGQTPGLPTLPNAVLPQNQPPDTTQQAQPKKDLLDTATDILTSLFPGSKTLGEYLGTKLAQSQATPTGAQMIQKYEPGPTSGQALAATGELGLEAGAMAIPGAGSLLGRIGTSAALGAGIGGLGAAATGQNVLQGAALGGVAGGALQGAGEGLAALANYLPKSIISAKFPKLSEDAADYLVNNKPIGTAKQIYNAAQSDMGQIGEEIGNTLAKPEYADKLINSQEIMGRAVAGQPDIVTSGLSNAGATPLSLRKTLSSLVGKTSGGLIDKLFPAEGGTGALTLEEAHDLSSDLGNAIRKSFADQPAASQSKKVGQQIYFALTSALKDNAPALENLFDEYSKNAEITTALSKAISRSGKLGLTDYLTLAAGFMGGGGAGAFGALAAKKAIQSPTTDIVAAKGLSALGKGLQTPLAQGAGSVAKLLGSAYAQPATQALTR